VAWKEDKKVDNYPKDFVYPYTDLIGAKGTPHFGDYILPSLKSQGLDASYYQIVLGKLTHSTQGEIRGIVAGMTTDASDRCFANKASCEAGPKGTSRTLAFTLGLLKRIGLNKILHSFRTHHHDVTTNLTLITRRSIDFFLLRLKLAPRCLAGETVAVSSALDPQISDLRL